MVIFVFALVFCNIGLVVGREFIYWFVKFMLNWKKTPCPFVNLKHWFSVLNWKKLVSLLKLVR